jgi:cyclophilin family peptidyl-prolyl cis-trans isomerase
MCAVLISCSRGASDVSLPTREGIPEAKVKELLAAEYERNVASLSLVDITHRSPVHRRHAARVLARSASETGRPLLEQALHDDDDEVVSWAAFGLGRLCNDNNARETSLAVATRAATLTLDRAIGGVQGPLDPLYAVATALGRCATAEAEATLRSWLQLSPDVGRHAVLGLVSLASQRKRLEDPTIVALLDAADRNRAFAIATLPLTRLESVDSTVSGRLVSLTPRLLESSGEERRFVIRALSLAGASGLPILERIVKDDAQYRPAERAEAVRVLGKLGEPGQKSLRQLLPRVARPELSSNAAWLLGADSSVLIELLTQLRRVDVGAKGVLVKLAEVTSQIGDSRAKRLRLDRLRCRAASLVAVDDASLPLLIHCAEVDGSREGKLAIIRVLDAGRLRGKAFLRFERLLEDTDPVVRLEALRLLSNHDEIRDRGQRLALLLSDASLGVVATAAEILSRQPELALKGERALPEVLEAVGSAVARSMPEDAIEVRTRLIDAASALAVLSAKPHLESSCGSATPALRQHAEAALRRLGEPKRSCAAPTKKRSLPDDFTPSREEVTLLFRTELTPLELRLDPSLAPFAVHRIISLAKAGFYDGIEVHRVVPGFVVQLGDRGSDGYGGAGKAPIPCELAPVPFAPFDVGMALSGSDSGSSQFFVTLGPYPQLGQDYTRVGRAGAGWDRLTVGDIVQKVELSP